MARERITLKPQHEKILQDMNEDIEWLEEEITIATAAGIDLGDLSQKVGELRKQRDGLLRAYGTKKEG